MKIKSLLLVLFILASVQTWGDDLAWDTYSDTWVTVDDLGRNVSTSLDGLSTPKENRAVGMFYYIWNSLYPEYKGHTINDNTEILKKNPSNPDWGSYVNDPYFWGKPLLGYYETTDDYLFYKHMQMMMDSGVDFLFFDCTNTLTYNDAVRRVMKEIDRREALGMKSPKLAFMLHTEAANTLYNLYLSFYCDSTYNKYWYMWQGKPLVFTSADEVKTLPLKVRNRFTYRYSWAWLKGQQANQWAWLEYYPQEAGWTTGTLGNKIIEQISVSVAQHATTKVGKSYHQGHEPSYDAYALCKETPYGLYYAEQWKRALAVDPPVVMITQMNECIAWKYLITNSNQFGEIRPNGSPKIGESYFVDEYNAEFSRDLEPHADSLMRDNYLMQTFDNIRKYKGVREVPIPSADRTIKVFGKMSQWDDVTPEFRDDRGDVIHRDSPGFNYMSRMVNNTGRNDIVASKVTKDSDNVYFYVRTRTTLTDSKTSNQWMMLYINADCNYTTGWEGYDYMVTNDSIKGISFLLKNNGGYKWTEVCSLPRCVADSEMCISIPRDKIGMGTAKDFDFKWADNTPSNPDILDFYLNGDVAPNGRFNYRYRGSVAGSGVETVAVTGSELRTFRSGDVVNVFYNSARDCEARIQVYNMLGSLLIERPAQLKTGGNSFAVDCETRGLIIKLITNDGKAVSSKMI
jgi:hypothetical protein